MKQEEAKDLQRIEAFSDGVFAIAATLLILEIKVPHSDEIKSSGGLLAALFNRWPSYLAYFLSFGSILISWMNHHRSSRILARSSKAFLFGNGFLLLTVTFIPFPTAVLAETLGTQEENIGVMFYSFSYLLANAGFNIWFYTMRKPEYILKPEVSPSHVNKLKIQVVSGFFVYLTTTIISYWAPLIGLTIIFALFILWVTMTVGEKNNPQEFG